MVFSKIANMFKKDDSYIENEPICSQSKEEPKIVFLKYQNNKDADDILEVISKENTIAIIETQIQNQMESLKELVAIIRQKGQYKINGFGTKWLLIAPNNIEISSKIKKPVEEKKEERLEVYRINEE